MSTKKGAVRDRCVWGRRKPCLRSVLQRGFQVRFQLAEFESFGDPVGTYDTQNLMLTNNPCSKASFEEAWYGAVARPPLPGTRKVTEQIWPPLFQSALPGKSSGRPAVFGTADALPSP
jgi:hypothetical protein